jgi:DNA polymerase III delta subunit
MARKALWSSPQLLELMKEVRSIEHRIKSGSVSHVYAALTEVIGRVLLAKPGEKPGKRAPLP